MHTFKTIHFRIRRILTMFAFFAVSLMIAALRFAPYLTARLESGE